MNTQTMEPTSANEMTVSGQREISLDKMPLRDVLDAMEITGDVCKEIVRRVSSMSDDELRSLDADSRDWQHWGWVVEIADDFETIRRIRERVHAAYPNRQRAPKGATDTVEAEAAKEANVRNKVPRTMFENAKIFETFFAHMEAMDPAVVLDKTMYATALRSSDPIASLEVLAANRLDNGYFTARSARETVKRLRPTPPSEPDLAAPASVPAPVSPAGLLEPPQPPANETPAGEQVIEAQFTDEPETTAEQESLDALAPYASLSNGELYVCDYADLPVKAFSADLVICDTSLLDWRYGNYEALAKAALGWLRIGGSCVVLVSPGKARMAANAMDQWLVEHWMLAVHCERQLCTNVPDGLTSWTKIGIWMGAGGSPDGLPDIASDSFPSKGSGLVQVAGELMLPGKSLVVDPLMRTDEVPLAAKLQGCRFIGCCETTGWANRIVKDFGENEPEPTTD